MRRMSLEVDEPLAKWENDLTVNAIPSCASESHTTVALIVRILLI